LIIIATIAVLLTSSVAIAGVVRCRPAAFVLAARLVAGADLATLIVGGKAVLTIQLATHGLTSGLAAARLVESGTCARQRLETEVFFAIGSKGHIERRAQADPA